MWTRAGNVDGKNCGLSRPFIPRRRCLTIFPYVMFVCCLGPRARTRISRGFMAKQLSEGGGKLKERSATFARKFAGRALSKAKGGRLGRSVFGF